MAAERKPTTFINLGKVLQERLTNYRTVVNKIRTEEENRFQRAIYDNSLDVGAQARFREDQLKKEEGRLYPDPEYISTIKSSISDLKKRNRWKVWQDGFKESFQGFELGRKTLEQHLTYLEETMRTTDDTEIKDNIKGQIHDTQKAIKERFWELTTTQIELKRRDGTAKALEDGIKFAEEGIARGALEKDELKQETMRSTLLVLRRELTQTKLVNEEMEINLKQYGGGGVDVKKDWLRNKLVSSSTTLEPTVIDGKSYSSERAYWQDRMNGFIDDFIEQKQNKYKNDIAFNYNQFGELKNDIVSKIKTETDGYLADPVFAPYADKLNLFKQNIQSQVINQKMTELSKKLELTNVRKGITDVKLEVDDLQKQFPEISLSPYYHQLNMSYAKKQEQLLQKWVEKGETELNALTNFVKNADLPEATKSEYISNILEKATTFQNIRNLEIPYSQFTMDKPIETFITELSAKYPVLSQGLTLERAMKEQQTMREKLLGIPEKKVEPIVKPPEVKPPKPIEPLPQTQTQPTSTPTGTSTLKAYDQSGNIVYVERGKYYPGISLTSPTTKPPITPPITPTPPTPPIVPTTPATPSYERFMAETDKGARIFETTREKVEAEAKKGGYKITQWKGFKDSNWINI